MQRCLSEMPAEMFRVQARCPAFAPRHRGLWILLPRPAEIEDSIPDIVLFDDMLRSNTRRGRAPADNSDVLAMFRLVYSGEGATQPLVDDSS